MNSLAFCAPSRFVDFLNIADNASPTDLDENQDLFIGKNKSVTLTLQNGTVTKVRDVVILGELIIKSSNPEDTTVKPSIIARDIFAPSRFDIDNINLKARHR